jgi:cysteine-rich repeat protein
LVLLASLSLAACGGSGDSTKTDGPVRGGGVGGAGGSGGGGSGGGGSGGSGGTGGAKDGPADAPESGSTGGADGGVDIDPEAPLTLDCTGKADGTECGSGLICVMQACVSSSCGDGFKDPATGEECEDGNTAAGDGCLNCRFECKMDPDCDDANACNGAETCDKSMAGKQLCKAGTAPAAGTACTIAGGGGAGVCMMGSCVKAGCGNGTVEAGEECDDMNADDTDGCTRQCKFTCKVDGDCSDGNMCTGVETCTVATHKCAAGTAKTCPASGSCAAAGTCTPLTGACVYPDADKDGKLCTVDCNDADPAVFPGGYECKDGKDNDCNAATMDGTAPNCECYTDGDRDGYAASVTGAIVAAGACPVGYTRLRPDGMTTTDCAARIAAAHPGQTAYFATSYCAVQLQLTCLSGRSFDYNCDTMETPRDGSIAAATCVGATPSALLCLLRSGWVGTVPACGMPGTYRQCAYSAGNCSGTDMANRVQECH